VVVHDDDRRAQPGRLARGGRSPVCHGLASCSVGRSGNEPASLPRRCLLGHKPEAPARETVPFARASGFKNSFACASGFPDPSLALQALRTLRLRFRLYGPFAGASGFTDPSLALQALRVKPEAQAKEFFGFT